MTINPTDRGKPTTDQVKTAWESTPKPSVRRVGEILRARGFDIADSTVQRWKKAGWHKDALPIGATVIAASHDRVKDILDVAAATKMPDAPAPADGEKPPTMEQVNELRFSDLMKMTEADMREIEAKARIAFNIMTMEKAARNVDVMILMAKETASLVVAMTDAAGAQRVAQVEPSVQNMKDVTPAAPAQNHQAMIDANPTASALDKFLRKKAASGAGT